MFTSLTYRRLVLASLACCAGLSVAPASAQSNYPTRPIKLVVPFAPGGSTDIVARLLAEQMRQILGQTIIVENRAGAGGAIGSEAVARAKPDGYTIGIGTLSTLAVNPIVLKASRVDPINDFTPITSLASIPSVFSVHPSLGVKDFKGFLELMRSKPDHFTAGSPGIGSIGHVILEAMNDDLGIQIRHIPYRGIGLVLNGALAGETQVLPDQYPSSAPHIAAGKLVPFAVSAEKRLEALPAIPTFKELGYPALNEVGLTWFGLVAPAKTPDAVVQRLNQAAREALSSPQLKERLDSLGVQPLGSSPQEFADMIRSSGERVRKVVEARGIEAE